MPESCARCGANPAVEDSPMCQGCQELGPLSPEEASRWRARQLEDDPGRDLVVGESYDVRTSDGTVYEDAELVGRDDGGYWFLYGPARVYVARHEFAGIEGAV